MQLHRNPLPPISRRDALHRIGAGLGSVGLAGMFNQSTSAGQASPLAPKAPHFAPKAKRVIYLFMSGGPSHHDLWSHKPKMREMFGKDLPEHVRDGQRITGMTAGQKTLPVCPSKYKYTRHDNNDQGVWVSELLPYTAQVAKELCVVHSTFTEAINHDPAITFFQTGAQLAGRPSMGSWLSYGLGSDNANLPAFVSNVSGSGGQPF